MEQVFLLPKSFFDLKPKTKIDLKLEIVKIRMIRTHAANGTIVAKALGHQGSKHTQLGKS